MIKFIKKLITKKHAPIVAFTCSYGGDMNGSYSATRIRKINDEEAEVCITYREWHHAPIDNKEYIVPVDVLKEINNIFDKYKLSKCPYQPRTRIFVCDAGTSDYEFEFEDGKSSSSNSDLIFTRKQNEGMAAVNKLIENYVKDIAPLPGFRPEPMNEESGFWDIVKGEVVLKIIEYSRNRLYYEIINGLEKDVEIKDDVILYRIDGDKKQEIFKYKDDYINTVGASYSHEGRFELKERLIAGKYLLVVDKYEKEFDIK